MNINSNYRIKLPFLKTAFICVITILYTVFGYSQAWMEGVYEAGKNPNFYEIQTKFYDYWKDKDTKEKGVGYKAFKRWEWYWEPRINADGTFPAAGITLDNFNDYSKKYGNKGSGAKGLLGGANWTSLGPNNSAGGYLGIGRINSIAFHPSNNNIIYIGAAGGGFWKTTNGGTTWTTSTDNIGSLGVSGIVVVPSTPNTIYIATGDGDGFDNYSIGVLKSTDGGDTWNTTGLNWSVNSGWVIRKLVIDPNDENTLLVASSNGIYRSTNAGSTWVQEQTGNFYDLEANPDATTNIFYASSGSSIFKSTNNGDTWTNVQTIAATNRIALGITAANSTTVYALCSKSAGSGFNGLYRSTNSGDSYTVQSTTPNILSGAQDGSGANGQGWYDLVVTVDPTNANIVYTGGVNTWKSVDAGVSWTLNTMWYGIPGVPEVHADKHASEWQGNTLFEGNDGGIYKTSNGGSSWTDVSGNLVISQMYRIDVARTDSRVITGLQDNGTKVRSTSGVWTDNIGGDGMDCAINPVTSTTMYAEYQNGNPFRTTNAGANWTDIKPAGSGSGAWITPITIDPATPTTIYIGYTDVYKSINQGTAWTTISTNLSPGSNLTILKVAPSNANYVYAGTSNALYRTINGGTTWNTMTMPGGGTNTIAISPLDPNIIWAVRQNYTAGSKVYKSIDGGASWTNISGTLPNIPASAIVYSPCTQDGLYVGMDVGVYYRDNTLSDWVLHNAGLPNVEIQDLEVDVNENAIYAATYGRGTWKSDLYMSTPLINISLGQLTNPSCGASDGSIVLNFTNTPNGTYLISYKKDNVPGSSSQTINNNSTTLINLGPGNYTDFSITVSGCIGTSAGPALLTGGPAPTVTISPTTATICSGQSITLTASGTNINSYQWSNGSQSNSINVSPGSTTTYSVTVTAQPGGCTASSSRTVNVNQTPSLTETHVEPTTCTSNDGSINLNISGVGPYTYNWSTSDGSGLVNGQEDQSGLSTGTYYVTVTAPGTCTSSTLISLTGPGNCGNCPSIGSLTSSDPNTCKQTNFTLTASGLTGMGTTYGITFKYFTAATADPYTGGTVIGTVANGSLTSGGTVATLSNANIPSSGSYFLYAILSPTPGDPTCRPSATSNINVVNCEVSIADPCACKNNATTLTNGQFDEVVVVNAPSGQSWTVSAISGLFLSTSPAPPSAPSPIPVGFALTEVPLGGGVSDYTLTGIHIDALGYSVTVTNGAITQSISNTCYYPNPTINNLASTYCANDPNVTMAGSAVLGGPPGGPATGVGTFTINGTPNTIFSPATLGAGTYNVVFSFDAADNNPDASHPGCIQTIPQSVLVNPVPTVGAVANATYCVGNTVPASNFTGTPGTVVFNWSRTAGAIGLAPLSGTGQVPSFVATNAGTTPIVVTFTVTPTVTAGGLTCSGTPRTYTITVNPTPNVGAQTNKVFCSGLPTGAINFSSTVAGTVFNWTNTNTGIGIGATGTGNIPSWIPSNLTGAPIVGTITVTPSFTNPLGGPGCPGTPITFTVTILPAPRAFCKNFTLFLNNSGLATLNSSDINNGSSGGNVSISKTNFACADIGANSVILTVTDPCGGTSSCAAVVSVVDNIPPVIVGNVVPLINLECNQAIPPAPVLSTTDNCSATISLVVTDNKSPHKQLCNFYSYTITRTWIAKDPSGNSSSRVQLVKIVDTTPPLMTMIPDAEVFENCDESGAHGCPMAIDDCDESPSIIFSYSYEPYIGGCSNSYTVARKWVAGDKCGNTSFVTQNVYVVDQEIPELTCPANIVKTSATPTQITWQNPKAWDDCDGSLNAIQIKGPQSGSLFEPGTTTEIVYRTIDNCGNADTCSFTITLIKGINTNPGSKISGSIANSSGTLVDDVELEIKGTTNQFLTAIGGYFEFPGLAKASNQELFASKLTKPLEGVNTLDIITITNHILGKKALISPQMMIAADVNKNNSISASDLVEIRKLILNLNDQFEKSDSWEFIPANAVFANPLNPWANGIPSSIKFENIQSDQVANLRAIKMGDVTGNATGNVNSINEVRSEDQLILFAENTAFNKGDNFDLTIKASDFDAITGMQFTLQFNPERLEFVGIKGLRTDITEENFGFRFLEDGKIACSINLNEQLSGNELFSISFKAINSGEVGNVIRLGSDITKSEAYTKSNETIQVKLVFAKNGVELQIPDKLVLHQNRPNPFNDYTAIHFDLPLACTATLTLYNLNGEIIKSIKGDFDKGPNVIRIEKAELPAAGTYFYMLNTDSESAVKKLILIE